MYSICHIIYGVVYDADINNQLAKQQNLQLEVASPFGGRHTADTDELEPFGWQFLYDGAGDGFPPGFLGVEMDTIEPTMMPHPVWTDLKAKSKDDLNLRVDKKVKDKYKELTDKQPDWLAIPEPKLYFIWSTS